MLKSLMFFGVAMAMLCLPGVLQAQEATPEASPYRLYRHEIGIGASIPFNSDRGAVLLYKHRLGKVQEKEQRTYQWSLRCMLTHAQNDYNFQFTEGMIADTFFQRRLTGTNREYDLGIGIERQQMRNRWRFYYGADLLFGWSNRPVDVDHLAIIEGQPEILLRQSQAEYTAWRTGGSGFAGVQWFFAGRWSLGTEISMSAWLEQTQSNAIIDNGYTSNTLEFSFWIPRLLYLSHHFGG
ncbi:MAG: hypothetical protein IT261_03560 [Saprospiraceae bacterium]|nr:hypothetical protein [Saprospiraceae bacterium]